MKINRDSRKIFHEINAKLILNFATSRFSRRGLKVRSEITVLKFAASFAAETCPVNGTQPKTKIKTNQNNNRIFK